MAAEMDRISSSSGFPGVAGPITGSLAERSIFVQVQKENPDTGRVKRGLRGHAAMDGLVFGKY
jgi:hypothetical protein